VRKFLQQYWWY